MDARTWLGMLEGSAWTAVERIWAEVSRLEHAHRHGRSGGKHVAAAIARAAVGVLSMKRRAA